MFWNGSEWVAEAPPATDVKRRSHARRLAAATLRAALITSLTFGLLASTAFAAKGAGGGKGGGSGAGTGSFTLVMVSDANSNRAANYGDTVTFKVETAASLPYMTLSCSQNGVVVWGQRTGFYRGWPWSQDFILKGGDWVPGPADCVATLTSWSSAGKLLGTLSTQNIHVDG